MLGPSDHDDVNGWKTDILLISSKNPIKSANSTELTKIESFEKLVTTEGLQETLGDGGRRAFGLS